MKLLHFSDTHLGFSEYNKIDPESGLNQREQDFYDAWEQVIEAIIHHHPDVVVHAGDLFHTSRPTNRAICVAFESIQKVSEAGIPLVIVSGNHSTPRIQSTGSIFESIALFPHVHAAYRGHYERFNVKGIDFHCIPHCSLSEELERAFKAIELQPSSSLNVMVTHGAWSAKSLYSMGEFNEQHLPDPEINLNISFNYIALGHYHRRVDIKPHVCYSGATERTSFNESAASNGYLLVDLESGDKQYCEIKTRPMLKLPPLDCGELSAAQIYDELEKLSRVTADDALLSLQLVELRHETLIQLEGRKIDELFSHALYLEKQFVQRTSGDAIVSHTAAIDSLPVEFERYINRMEFKELDKDHLKRLGIGYLSDE